MLFIKTKFLKHKNCANSIKWYYMTKQSNIYKW